MSIQSPLPWGGIIEITVSSIGLFLAIIAVILRFYARSLQRKAISIDDYLIVAGLVFTIATVGVGYALVLNGGAGLHMVDATPEETTIALKLFIPAPLMWASSTFFVKLSILFFYISIFTMPRLRTAVYIVITLTVALILSVILRSFLLCRPFAYTWDKTIPGGVCGSQTKSYLAIAVANLFIDLALVSMPMPILWRLKMPVEKKVAVSAILGLGIFICGFTAARIKCVVDLDPLDFTYTMWPDLCFGALEIELGIVNACLPILRPVFRKVFGSNYSVFGRGRSKESDLPCLEAGKKGNAHIGTEGFDRMPDNKNGVGEVVTGVPPSQGVAQAHVYSSYDLESREQRCSSEIMVRKDLHIYSTPTSPAGTVI